MWSPYLAADLPDLLARLQQVSGNPKLKVALVADRLEGRYFQTPWSEALAASIDDESLAFHHNPSFRHNLVEITHAKAWLFRSTKGCRLAIGSWNFTHAGTSSFEQRNIEAGIVLNYKRNADMLGDPIDVTEADFASDLLLLEDTYYASDRAYRGELIQPPPNVLISAINSAVKAEIQPDALPKHA